MPNVAPSPALFRFAERQSRIAQEIERRSESRHLFAQPVVVQCLDEAFRPLGRPLAAMTRDISASGIGLIFETTLSHDLAALRLNVDEEEVCLLIEVLWRRPMEPFEYVGGRVLQELENIPTSDTDADG